MFSYFEWKLGKIELFSQKLCTCEMGENAIKVIDFAIYTQPGYASCGKVIQVELVSFLYE